MLLSLFSWRSDGSRSEDEEAPLVIAVYGSVLYLSVSEVLECLFFCFPGAAEETKEFENLARRYNKSPQTKERVIISRQRARRAKEKSKEGKKKAIPGYVSMYVSYAFVSFARLTDIKDFCGFMNSMET